METPAVKPSWREVVGNLEIPRWPLPSPVGTVCGTEPFACTVCAKSWQLAQG